MASTFTAAKAAAGVMEKFVPSGVLAVHGQYEISAALVLNDVIQMVKVPKNAVILDVILATDDLDDGTNLVLAVGGPGAADKFITGSTIGQAGGVEHMNQVDGFGYVMTADDTIDVKVTTAPGSGKTSGTLNLIVLYSMDA